MSDLCEHGMSGEPYGIDGEALMDPDDYGIMAYYSGCDCCGLPMHHSSPYQYIQETGQTLCFACRDLRYPMPLESWEKSGEEALKVELSGKS